MTARDWRAGELRLLAAALVTAVAAVTSVGFLVDRIRLGLERDASQLLGADLVLSSDSPIDAALAGRARAAGLQTASTVVFPSMALSEKDGDRNALAAVKAVSAGYPLRGRLRVSEAPGAADAPTRGRAARQATSGSTRNCCSRSARASAIASSSASPRSASRASSRSSRTAARSSSTSRRA